MEQNNSEHTTQMTTEPNINNNTTTEATLNPAGHQDSSKENQGHPKSYYFETETKRLKQYYLSHPQELLGRRVLFNNSAGKVRYLGPLIHPGKPAGPPGELWVGLEWEDLGRGKHNGTVNGHQYFKCDEGQGSMIKYEKIEFGYRLQIGLFKRYFRAEQLHHAKDIYDNLKEIKEELKGHQVEGKEAKIQEALAKKAHTIQYDAEAYLHTVKQSKKILIEFVGFDQIWHKINSLDKIQSISLAGCKICDLGSLGHLTGLLKNLRVLSLEDNLLSDWNQIYQLGYELPHLNELSVAYNDLEEPKQSFEELKAVSVTGRNESFELGESPLFKSLRCLILIGTGLTWRSFFKVAGAFRGVHEFILCKNDLSDFQHLPHDKLHYLNQARFLNLEETRLTDFSQLQVFSQLPRLERLILNKNLLKNLGRQTVGFGSLKHLSVQHCGFEAPVVLFEISLMRQLQSLNVKHNPIGDKFGNSYVRMRAVAEIPKLTMINGAQLKKVQRKDFEIFYLRESFREYFAFKKVPDYDYDYQDFLAYCQVHHPNIPRLVAKYGNPYQVEKKQEIQVLIKEEVKATENKKGTGMVQVAIEYKQTQLHDHKRVPLSWTLSSLKNFLSKTSKIPVGMLRLYCLSDSSSAPQEMTEDHKTLSFYQLKNGSKIIVERKV